MSHPTAPGPVEPGRELLAGRYRLIRPIASGGMAQVWEAVDEVLTRPVAVKILHRHLATDEVFVARFRAEAVSAARLAHPAIVSIYDTWSGDGVEAIVMELVRGTTLRYLLDHRGQLPVDEAVTVADHVASALEAAHRAGIVHRDIKPANVLLSADGRVLVTDFGIAKASEGADLTAEASMLGTAKYLAPEQVAGGPVDGRADLYALGVVLYEMLAGRPPFTADTEAATALARLHRDPEPLTTHRPGLPGPLCSTVAWCLARDPADRPLDATALRRALAGDGPVTAPTAAVPLAGPAPPVPSDSVATTASPLRPPPVAPVPVAGLAPTTAPPASPEAPPTDEQPPRRRRGLVLATVAVAAVIVMTVGLFARDLTDGGGGPPRRLQLAGAEAFDPLGNPPGEENNSDATLATDGDASSAWRTERYRDPDRMGKAGVGLIVRIDDPADLTSLVVAGPSAGWSASVYVADDSPGTDLASWGEPVAGARGLGPGTVRFDLRGRRGAAVLLWITRTGDDGRVEVAEASVTGR